MAAGSQLTTLLAAKLLLALASIVIFGSESHGTHIYILLSDSSGPCYIASGQTTQKTPPPTTSSLLHMYLLPRICVYQDLNQQRTIPSGSVIPAFR
jgi:hypothetical protein